MKNPPSDFQTRIHAGALAAAAFTMLCGQLAAATPRRNDSTAAPVPAAGNVELKHDDRAFVEKVLRASMDDVAISRVAAERTSNPRVRELAEAMMADHQRLQDQLARLAAGKSVALPAKDSTGDKWRKRDAKSFDRDYVKRMISDHEAMVKQFEKQARDGHDPELVDFARNHLEKLQQHLNQASDLHRLMK